MLSRRSEAKPPSLAPHLKFVCLVVTAAVITATFLVSVSAPHMPTFVVCFGLAVLAAHVSADDTDETLSAPFGMLVVIASYVGHVHGSALIGASAMWGAGLFARHARQRMWDRLAFNTSQQFLAALVSAAAFELLVGSGRPGVAQLVLASAMAAVVYAIVNFSLVTSVVSLATGNPLAEVMAGLGRAQAQSIFFGVMGGALGWAWMSFGLVAVPLIVAPIFIARQVLGATYNLRVANESTLRALTSALEAKDAYTAGHVERVAQFSVMIGERLGIEGRELQRLRHGALMHDIGKLVVPNGLLNKPGRLTEAEFAVVKRHESVAVEILDRIDFLRPIIPAASGQFHQYAGHEESEAPIEPFIINVADAFDAMTSTRAYRKALSQETAFTELRDKAGSQFHPACVDALIDAIEASGDRYGDGVEVAHVFAVAPPEAGLGSAGLGDLAMGTALVD